MYQKSAPETYIILLINVTPINLTKKTCLSEIQIEKENGPLIDIKMQMSLGKCQEQQFTSLIFSTH